MKKQPQLIILFCILTIFLSPKTLQAQLITGIQGSGTENDPVLIQSAHDLKLLSDYINSGGNSTGKYFKLGNNIDFENEVLEYDLDENGENESNFRPIGNNLEHYFKGYFNGDNHTISGLKIKSAGGFIGLFGVAVGTSSNARNEIKNITLSNSYFECLSEEAFIAGISAYTQWCNLKNCNAYIEIVSNVNYTIAGGINAYNYQNKIEDCYFNGTIASIGKGSTLGGFISAGGQSGSINRCYANVTITSIGDSCYIGGFGGSTHTPINNSYSKGTITNSGEGCVIGGFIGGLVSGGNISNSYTTCNVTSNNKSENGGFAGKLLSSVSITNSYYINSWSNQIYENNSLGVVKSEIEMKQEEFVAVLNNSQSSVVWSADIDNKNNGFPVLNTESSSSSIISPKNENNLNISFRNGNINIVGKQLEYLQIMDIQGRIVMKENISGDYYQSKFSHPTGIYTVIVKSASYIQTDKLLFIK